MVTQNKPESLMSGKYVEVDVSEFSEFVDQLHELRNDLPDKLAEFLDAAGVDMLRIIEDEIKRKDVIVTGDLMSSFTKGGEGNIYTLTEGDLTLEIGSNLEYASYANDGHDQIRRWIPGVWKTSSRGKAMFQYDPGADTGMMLTEKRVDGKHYMESAVHIIEKLFPTEIEKAIYKWVEEAFK